MSYRVWITSCFDNARSSKGTWPRIFFDGKGDPLIVDKGLHWGIRGWGTQGGMATNGIRNVIQDGRGGPQAAVIHQWTVTPGVHSEIQNLCGVLDGQCGSGNWGDAADGVDAVLEMHTAEGGTSVRWLATNGTPDALQVAQL